MVETGEPEPETASVTDLMECCVRRWRRPGSRRKPGNANRATRLTTRAADQKPPKATGRSKTRSGTAGSGGDRTRSSPVAER